MKNVFFKRLYAEIAFNEFRANISYRAEVFFFLLGALLRLFIQVFIWKALYGGASVFTSAVGAVSLDEMITYSVLSNCIAVFTENSIIYQIGRKVDKGEIAMDLVKPVSFFTLTFFQSFGICLYRVAFNLVPVAAVSVLFFHVTLPSPLYFCLFLLMIFGGLMLNFLMNFIIGILSFWYGIIWQVATILEGLIAIFSGAFVPMWFFPEVFNVISVFMPFRLMYYAPIAVCLGKAGPPEIAGFFLQQAAWIAGLLLLERFMWQRALKKLEVQGG